jgi:hypothetical protein
MLELHVSEPDQVLDKLAEILGTTCEDGYLKVPEDKGRGYLKGFFLGSSISLMIRDCEFNAALLIKRNFNLNPQERVLFSFNAYRRPEYSIGANWNRQTESGNVFSQSHKFQVHPGNYICVRFKGTIG